MVKVFGKQKFINDEGKSFVKICVGESYGEPSKSFIGEGYKVAIYQVRNVDLYDYIEIGCEYELRFNAYGGVIDVK